MRLRLLLAASVERRHIEHEANKLLARGCTDSNHMNWWRAIAIGFGAGKRPGGKGRLSESLRELNSLRSKRDFELPSVVALLFFHERTEYADRNEINDLENDAMIQDKLASHLSLVLAAQFQLCAGLHDSEQAEKRFALSRSLSERVISTVVRNVTFPCRLLRLIPTHRPYRICKRRRSQSGLES